MHLLLYSEPTKPSRSPEFVRPYLKNVTVSYRSTAVLHCHVHTDHEPLIQVTLSQQRLLRPIHTCDMAKQQRRRNNRQLAAIRRVECCKFPVASTVLLLRGMPSIVMSMSVCLSVCSQKSKTTPMFTRFNIIRQIWGQLAALFPYVEMPVMITCNTGMLVVQWLRRVDSASSASNGTVRVGDKQYTVVTGAYSGMQRHDGTYTSRLIINNATERHTGYYVCSATNTYGFNYVGAYLRVVPPSPSESTLLLSLSLSLSLC